MRPAFFSPTSTIWGESAIGESTRDTSVRVVVATTTSPRRSIRGTKRSTAVTVYSPPMTENRPESPGSHRRCETAKLVVLQSKTSNNRSYQNLQLVIRCSRVRAAVNGLVLWVAQSSSPLPRSWLVLRTRSALTSLVRFAVTVDEVISRCRGRAASVRAASVRAASGALVPASTSGSRNTLAVRLFEARSIGEAVMAV